MKKELIYSIHYRLNGKEQTKAVWADRRPSTISHEDFKKSLEISLKKAIGYNRNRDELDILSIEQFFN